MPAPNTLPTKYPPTLVNAILELLAKNPYGMTANLLAHELGVGANPGSAAAVKNHKTLKANIVAVLTGAVEAKVLVDYKVAKNHRMYSLPHTCGWSTYAAKMAGIEKAA